MPTADTVAHDMDIDSQGNVWYTDESRQMIGKLDPRTATFTEYDLPPVNEGDVPGTRDVQVDLHDNVWFPMRVPGSGTVLTRFDPETEDIKSCPNTRLPTRRPCPTRTGMSMHPATCPNGCCDSTRERAR